MCIYVGHCDVTLGQSDIPHLFFPDFWQNGNFALSRSLLIRLQIPPNAAISHILSHTLAPSVSLCLSRIEQVAKKHSGHFLNEDFIHCLLRLSCVHPSTHCLLRLSCNSSARFIKSNQTVLVIVRLEMDHTN